MASLPLSCTLAPSSSHLKQSHKIVRNPTSTLFNHVSYTRTNNNKPNTHFKVSASEANNNEISELILEISKPEESKRSKQWGKALDTLLYQVTNIRKKIDTEFSHQKDVAEMDVILDDIVKLVEIHKFNNGKGFHHNEKPISTTEAMMNLSKHFLAHRQSEREDGVLPVDPRPKKRVFSPMLIDMFTGIANLLYGQRGDSQYLQGNFRPVRETPPTQIDHDDVEGVIPDCIRGMFIRNGPNPQYDPLAKHAWLDGDGMLHATTFHEDKKITYTARYVQTSRYKQEQISGQAEFQRSGDYVGAFGMFAAFTHLIKSVFLLDTTYGCGLANENLIYHAGSIMALEDFDRPYAIKIKENGDIETLGIYDFKNKLTHNCTPHVKKDPDSGKMFVFGSSFEKPYMTYNVVSDKGIIEDPPVEIEGISEPTYMHDFGITEKYVIIMDLPFTFNPEAMLKNNDWVFNLNESKKSRFGIRSRDPKNTDPIKWFEFDEQFHIFHNANAWEEGNTVVLYGCKYPKKIKDDKVTTIKPGLVVGENKAELDLPKLFKFTFHMDTEKAEQKEVSANEVEHPKINEKYWGRKSRYTYAYEYDTVERLSMKNQALIKYDLENDTVMTRVLFGENKFGSEVVFIPSSKDETIEEDDGYLLTYVHDEAKRISYVYVYCAKTMEKVASVKLPSRVPYGYHAIFVKEEELLEHRNKIYGDEIVELQKKLSRGEEQVKENQSSRK